jgi:hypothetical protein
MYMLDTLGQATKRIETLIEANKGGAESAR